MEVSIKTVNLVLRDLPLTVVPRLRAFIEAQGEAAGDCQLDLIGDDEEEDPLTKSERAALKHPAHRRHAERLERLLWEGMHAPGARAAVDALLGTADYTYTGRSTTLFHEARSLKACAGQILVNKERHGLGADGVLLVPGKSSSQWVLHLFQVKAGATMISNTKSTCGPTNRSRCTYFIAQGLVDIGEHLSMLLRLQFPSSPRNKHRGDNSNGSDNMTLIECVHHLFTFSPLGASARIDLKKRGIRVVEADACYALLPERVRAGYALVDSHFERH